MKEELVVCTIRITGQYLLEEFAWQRRPFTLRELFMKQNKQSTVMPITLWDTWGHLTEKKYEWLIHCVAENPSVAVVEVWSQFIYFFMFIFFKLPAVPKLSVLATVYRCLLGNRESKYLVSCVFRQPINMPKYSLSKECRQIHISVEGPFVFGLNIQPLLYMSKHQQN